MLDTCTKDNCETLVDIDGYIEDLHGPIFCSTHQPKHECGEYMFNGICPFCDWEEWDRKVRKFRNIAG